MAQLRRIVLVSIAALAIAAGCTGQNDGARSSPNELAIVRRVALADLLHGPGPCTGYTVNALGISTTHPDWAFIHPDFAWQRASTPRGAPKARTARLRQALRASRQQARGRSRPQVRRVGLDPHSGRQQRAELPGRRPQRPRSVRRGLVKSRSQLRLFAPPSVRRIRCVACASRCHMITARGR